MNIGHALGLCAKEVEKHKAGSGMTSGGQNMELMLYEIGLGIVTFK